MAGLRQICLSDRSLDTCQKKTSPPINGVRKKYSPNRRIIALELILEIDETRHAFNCNHYHCIERVRDHVDPVPSLFQFIGKIHFKFLKVYLKYSTNVKVNENEGCASDFCKGGRQTKEKGVG